MIDLLWRSSIGLRVAAAFRKGIPMSLILLIVVFFVLFGGGGYYGYNRGYYGGRGFGGGLGLLVLLLVLFVIFGGGFHRGF